MLDRGGLYRSRRGRALSAYTTVDHRRIIVPHHELVNQQQGLEEVVLRPLSPVGSIYEVEAVMEMTKDFNLAQALSSIFTVNGLPASHRQELHCDMTTTICRTNSWLVGLPRCPTSISSP
ncbi:hypothetical protein MCOR27_007699 [Pyricularia oryzae]|nr:hypothetical protein MCOR27_007699 [Pyricularia oryzae]KAI6315750.1 hypothetical protein MCOR34_004575 [Pyricularia oryzae]KAI6318832.1 hypothetical protein MCOR29_005819 [Pyricularia oryzae]KAI6394204.1 hypothetical protein MCOR20_010602 [Pyricularia oryzae]KAI6484813.1 hypothetical protein MCOR13_009881 [Pyricularia oryzae]